jgi:hypothetical protein
MKAGGPVKKYREGGRVRRRMSDEDRADLERQRAMERGLEMRGGRGIDEYWQTPVNRMSPGSPDMSDPRYMMERPAQEYRMKKGGKVPAGGKAMPPAKKPVKMQKGGMVPCKGCPNPAACRRAGRCMMAG